MSIAPTDIVFRLSTAAGAAGDTTASTPDASLGKFVSTTAITPAAIANLFDNTTGAESAAGDVEYRQFFVLNSHATLTATNATITVASETASGGTIDIAVDNIGPVAKNSPSPQAAVIANEQTAPTGVGAFGDGPLALGDLAPGQVRGVWVRRTVPAGAGGANPDGVLLDVDYDTLP